MKTKTVIHKVLIVGVLLIGLLNLVDYFYAVNITNAANSGLTAIATVDESSTLVISDDNVVLDIVPSVEGTFSSAHTSVGNYSNTRISCVMTMTTSYTDLVSGTDSIATLSDSVSEASFAEDRWGYRVGTSGNYNAVETNNIISSYSGWPSSAGQNADVYFATKLTPATKPGTYTNTVTFMNTCAPVPLPSSHYIQDFTLEECQEYATDADYTLYDRRDGNDYTVRYIEGACWMTQNLRITGTVSSEDSNFSRYSSVDVCEVDLESGTNYDRASCHDSGNKINGVWYDFPAATAKTIIRDNQNTPATQDICPANWHLPTRDTNNSAGSIDSLSSTSTTSMPKFSPVTGGYYIRGSLSSTEGGYYWSATPSSGQNRLELSYNYNNTGVVKVMSTLQEAGNYIRCVRL